ncbi:MAG: 50S ribosomal protein L9 [Baekduia sp.]
MPDAILLKDVENVGRRGDVVDVSKGYLRNYLLPRKLAQAATKGALREAERLQEITRKADEARRAEASEHAEQLGRTVLTLPHKAGEDGRLFGSVTSSEIADAIKEARGFEVDRRKVHLSEPIKHIGTYQVDVDLVDGVRASVKVLVSEA